MWRSYGAFAQILSYCYQYTALTGLLPDGNNNFNNTIG